MFAELFSDQQTPTPPPSIQLPRRLILLQDVFDEKEEQKITKKFTQSLKKIRSENKLKCREEIIRNLKKKVVKQEPQKICQDQSFSNLMKKLQQFEQQTNEDSEF
ncbi:hypothetical protein SS50377_22823 [Spironucleus salmonicida]|uniref:Uncharacterized protein n=1 Tax=Spironucleus salmonicida TaxID=348837 RepID=V6LTH6_9EUKA|nr:hypothetical protein SS50377_22823 [Spironucleus salmonicida]|eukprot:EST47885.1 Hypothetical protein SS50377_11986 [Spironucleus salmonicida]